MECADIRAIVRGGGQPHGADAAAHVESCPACATLVATPALAGVLDRPVASAPTDPAALLAAALTAVDRERGPAAALRALSSRWRLALALAVLVAIPTVAVMLGPRLDLTVYPLPRLLLELCAYVLPAAATVMLGLWPLHRPEPRQRRVIATVLAVLGVLVVASLPAAHADHPASLQGGGADFLKRAFGCFAYGTICAAPMLLLLKMLARDGDLGLGKAVLLALAAVGCGSAAVFLHCPIVHVGHRWAGHVALLIVPLLWALWQLRAIRRAGAR